MEEEPWSFENLIDKLILVQYPPAPKISEEIVQETQDFEEQPVIWEMDTSRYMKVGYIKRPETEQGVIK